MNLMIAVPMVLDFETTGINPEKDRAVEIATVIPVGRKIVKTTSLINPGIPIPPEASAIHHLIDADVVNARPWAEVKAVIDIPSFDVFVAHNAEFDMAFYAHDGGLPEGKPIICTWRMAKKLLPDMPSYSNMALHYRLGLPGRPTESHRALADALVTFGLYKHLLALASAQAQVPGQVDIEAFVKWLAAPMMEKKIYFGKYRDELWMDIAKRDPNYLKWVLDKSDIAAKNPDVKFTIQTLLKGTR
jgi:exodeoxyribonuclease X